MMTLITGQPGHGKTAYAITRIIAFIKEGRDVYVHGIKNFDYEKAGAHRIEDPAKWQDLPDGSVVVLDECYSAFPNRNPGAKVPDHVEKLATHRHRGFDFIFLAQQSLQIDPFMKGLFEEHIHVRKKFGKYTKLLRWSQFQSNIKAICNDDEDWLRPGWVFDYYTSTVKDTSKVRIPKWVWLLAGMAVLIYFGYRVFQDRWTPKTEPASDSTTSMLLGASTSTPRGTSGAGGDAGKVIKWETASHYAQDHLPRFASMPWTAPVFDQRSVVADPQLYCMATEAGLDAMDNHAERSCSCLTEQGTRYDISDGECRRVARMGMPYNPYRAALPATPPQAAQVPQAYAEPRMAPPPPRASVVGSAGTVGQPMVDRSFGTITRPVL